MRPTLVIFVKEPVPGRVKTRLGRGIGPVAAAWWFRHAAARLIREVGGDPRWETVLAVTPDRGGLTSRVWPARLARWPQGGGDLGARMARALTRFGPGPVAVIGADIPGIRRAQVAEAFAMLGRPGAVLGPATDGGYWLIGLGAGTRPPAGMLRGVRWSSPRALAETARTLRPLPVRRAATLGDVDTAEDLLRLCGPGALR